jgi:hypothetical protein
MKGDLTGYWVLIEVDGNVPIEHYFYHLRQNGIDFLSRQLLLIG